ncbi:MAG: hypothetical protein SV377_04785 [Halobacteria archaeon]|nr:hypothetical protein [Halobacteria archaeon]
METISLLLSVGAVVGLVLGFVLIFIGGPSLGGIGAVVIVLGIISVLFALARYL